MGTESKLVAIALCGKARAGKDTVAQALASQAGFFRMALADGLKSLLNDLDGHTWEFRKERDAAGKSDRWAAQQAGTECREAIDDRYHWVNHLGIKLHYANKVHPAPRYRFVVPDLRYPYEGTRLRKIVESLGGRLEIWRIDRPGQDAIAESGHSSEMYVDKILVDLVIENTGTLEQLNESVKGAVRVSLIHKHKRAQKLKELEKALGCPACHGGSVLCKQCADEFAYAIERAGCPAEPASSPGGQGVFAAKEGMDYISVPPCRDEWQEFCDYMRWSPEPPKQEPVPAPAHDIPVIDDALNDLGPFPVLYLSGPMSGYRDLNFPAFNKAAEKLRRLGFPVLNPADFGACNDLSWEENLHRDLHYLGFADIVVQLPGWADSRGASLEYNTAVALGKGVTSIYTLIGEWQ